jgi:hypothetical protein
MLMVALDAEPDVAPLPGDADCVAQLVPTQALSQSMLGTLCSATANEKFAGEGVVTLTLADCTELLNEIVSAVCPSTRTCAAAQALSNVPAAVSRINL